MSLSTALSVALTGLQANTTQLQLAANNIANAQTPGYTAKKAIVSSTQLGAEAGGATIVGFARSSDAAISKAYNAAISDASFYGTQNTYLKQVQTILNSNTDNPALSDLIAKFQSAWTQFAASPETSSQQQAVIQAGTNLAAQIRSISSQVVALTRQVTSEISSSVDTLNAGLQKIAQLNAQIATAVSSGQQSGNLEDLRDQTVNEIAQVLAVTTVPRNNGQIAVYTPGGLLLLDTTNVQTFSTNGTTVTNAAALDVTSSLKGGALESQLNFKYDGSPTTVSSAPGSEVIRKLNAQLTEITDAFTSTTAGSPTTFALAYNSATTAAGELASSFFSVTLNAGVPDPSTLVVNANLLNNSATLKVASGAPVVTALNAVRTFTADGLLVNNGTYADLGTAVLANFQQAANTVASQNDPAQQQQVFYEKALSDATGVNVDNELVTLTVLQNAYAASAHVISTVNQMIQTLQNIF